MMLLAKAFGYSLVVMLVLSVCAIPALADWQEMADKTAAVEIEDNPEWEKYAFELEYVDSYDELSFIELARADMPFILFFWLNDCPVCHVQMPFVQQLQNIVEQYDIDLRVVSINLDYDPKLCLEYRDEHDLSFELLIDPGARYTGDGYHLADLGTPVSYVFNADGELVDYLTGLRNEFARSVFRMLEMELPQELQSR